VVEHAESEVVDVVVDEVQHTPDKQLTRTVTATSTTFSAIITRRSTVRKRKSRRRLMKRFLIITEVGLLIFKFSLDIPLNYDCAK